MPKDRFVFKSNVLKNVEILSKRCFGWAGIGYVGSLGKCRLVDDHLLLAIRARCAERAQTLESAYLVDAAPTSTARAGIARLANLVAIETGKARRTDARVALLGVGLLTDAAVFAGIESTSLTRRNASTVCGVSHQFGRSRADDKTTDAADKATIKTRQFVDGTEVGYAPKIEWLEEVEAEETAANRTSERPAFAIIHQHGAIFLVAAELHRVPLTHFDGFVRLDNGWTGTDIESELGVAIAKTERDKIAAATRLLSVVQDQS